MRWDDHDRRDGHLDAWKRLNAIVADDLAEKRGDIKPPRMLYKFAHPLKTHIGRFAARMLRGEFKNKKHG